MTSTVHLEAYDWAPLKQRMFVLGELEDALNIYLRLQQDLLFRGRKVLVIAGQDSTRHLGKLKLFEQSWDFILRVRANIDYSLFASYLQHAPKPVSVLWLGSEIPSVLLAKFEQGVYWICHSGTLPAGREIPWIFISPSLPTLKYKDWFLNHSPVAAAALLENLEDLREKKAGIVFHLTDRTVKWYDSAGLEEAGDETSIQDIRDVLKWCFEKLAWHEA
jgi:hypothetical protein